MLHPHTSSNVQNEMPRMRPEDELLLLSGRHKTRRDRTERQREILSLGLDWNYLIKSARNHRMVPLLHRTLTSHYRDLVPDDFLNELIRSNLLNAKRNIILANELIHVIMCLEDNGIPVMPFKGPVLAMSAYGGLFLRQFDDLDILIPPSKIGEADKLLHSLGYKEDQLHSRISEAQKSAMQKYQHHHHFYCPAKKVHLEVHWALSPELYSFHQESVHLWDRSEPVTLLSRELRGLSLEDTLVLLCDHAVRHQWNRLSWISDVAMLLGSECINWDFVMERAREWRAKRALLLGLLLAKDLLDASLPKDINGEVDEDLRAKSLAYEVVGSLFCESGAPEKLSLDPVSRNIHDQLFYIKARDNLRDRTMLYLRLVTTPTVEDWNYLSLPDPLFPLYHLIRPIRQANEYRMKILDWILR